MRRMTAQQAIILSGCILVAVMTLFPPYLGVHLRDGDNLTRFIGYYFILQPPELEEVRERMHLGGWSTEYMLTTKLDTDRLATQIVVVTLLTLGLAIVFKQSPRHGTGLLHCPDCGHKVSDLAAACLECGRPVSTMRHATSPSSTSSHVPIHSETPADRPTLQPYEEAEKAGIAIRRLLSWIGAALWGIMTDKPTAADRPILQPYEKVGMAMRLLSWIGAAFWGIMLVAMVPQPDSDRDGWVILACLLFVVSSVFGILVGNAILHHKQWARIVGILIGVGMIPCIVIVWPAPAGAIATAVGVYMLWGLIARWDVRYRSGGREAL